MTRSFSQSISALVVAVACSSPAPIGAQTPADDVANTAWRLDAMIHLQRMRAYHDVDTGTQPTPATIPQRAMDADPSGIISSYQPNGDTQTSSNAFFKILEPMGARASPVTRRRPAGRSAHKACKTDLTQAPDRSDIPPGRWRHLSYCRCLDLAEQAATYSLLLSKGLIRIGLPIPANTEFQVGVVSDPYNCNTNPATGLLSPTSGIVSIYRRPLPSTNLGFLSAVMWDGREPSLLSQSVDATLGHAQANASPSAAQQQQIVDFESGLFTAQHMDEAAKNLDADGATGGPVTLQAQLGSFYIGINDPLGGNPTGAQFTPNIFNLFQAWTSLPGTGGVNKDRTAVARGETIFNSTPINITGVVGLNDVLGMQSIPGFCGTCHDTPNVGNYSVKAPLNIGIANAGPNSPPASDISGLPVFMLNCTSGPLAGQSFVVTDPGRALISGKCADIGKVKGPILRGLAARAPYFHNGSAATLSDVVEFYNQRFNLGLTDQQKSDLVEFLRTL